MPHQIRMLVMAIRAGRSLSSVTKPPDQSGDSDSELVTRLETTPGNANDSKEFPKVVDSKANTVTAQTLQFSSRDTYAHFRVRLRRKGEERGKKR
jgi:hypothetical protein